MKPNKKMFNGLIRHTAMMSEDMKANLSVPKRAHKEVNIMEDYKEINVIDNDKDGNI